MDAIILAAGKGSRLKGVAAPYHKPLMVVNGEPIIRSAVRKLTDIPDIGRIIIVAAPQNIDPIVHLTDDYLCHYIIQPKATGPGSALITGLELVKSDTVMVIMGDHTVKESDLAALANSANPKIATIGTVFVDEVAAGFTRYIAAGSGTKEGWIETDDQPGAPGPYEIWLGPFVTGTEAIRTACSSASEDMIRGNERLIGPLFNLLHTQTRKVSSVDIGTALSSPTARSDAG